MNKFFSFVAVFSLLLWASCQEMSYLPGVGLDDDFSLSDDSTDLGESDTLECDTCHHHGHGWGHAHGHHGHHGNDSLDLDTAVHPGHGMVMVTAGMADTYTIGIVFPVATHRTYTLGIAFPVVLGKTILPIPTAQVTDMATDTVTVMAMATVMDTAANQ